MLEENYNDHYEAMVDLVSPYFPEQPGMALSALTEIVGHHYAQVLLTLIWKALQLKSANDLQYAIPYLTFEGRFSMI